MRQQPVLHQPRCEQAVREAAERDALAESLAVRVPPIGSYLVIDGVVYTVVSHSPEYETGNRRRMGVEIEINASKKETS